MPENTDNDRIADLLDELGDLVDLQGGNPYRVRSYHSAAQVVRNSADRLAQAHAEGEDLTELPNVGERIGAKIVEIIETGTCDQLEALREETPSQSAELLTVPNLGPKGARQLQGELGIDDLPSLREACERHQIQELDGWGATSERKLLNGIDLVARTAGRILRDQAARHIAQVRAILDVIPAVERWAPAGSFRRGVPTVGDLDVLVQAGKRQTVTEALQKDLDIEEVIAHGEEKVSLRLTDGPQLDIRYTDGECFGAALIYFTGSKSHSIALRRRAQDRQRKLSEYGLFHGDTLEAGRHEQEVYAALDLDWIPPELRENRGEIAAAATADLPDLLTDEDIRGDLQCHSTASDGAATPEAMADAARSLGYAYLALTDHSQGQRQAGGLDDEAARRHCDRIHALADELDDFRLLAGIEVDIHRNGKLDLTDETLRRFDWVVGSVHSHFDLSVDEQSARLERAFASGLVHAWGHPTARMLRKRDGIAWDRERVLAVCAKHRVCVEINAQPQRLDLPEEDIRVGVDAGVYFCLGTDAHAVDDFRLMAHAVTLARRAWLPPDRVINTLGADGLQAWLAER
jgi:DNA polymerase (family X)